MSPAGRQAGLRKTGMNFAQPDSCSSGNCRELTGNNLNNAQLTSAQALRRLPDKGPESPSHLKNSFLAEEAYSRTHTPVGLVEDSGK